MVVHNIEITANTFLQTYGSDCQMQGRVLKEGWAPGIITAVNNLRICGFPLVY